MPIPLSFTERITRSPEPDAETEIFLGPGVYLQALSSRFTITVTSASSSAERGATRALTSSSRSHAGGRRRSPMAVIALALTYATVVVARPKRFAVPAHH